MKLPAFFALAVLTFPVFAADDNSNNITSLPPVLRPLEPADSRVFRLPRPSAPAPAVRTVRVAAPMPAASPLPSRLTPTALPPVPFIRTSAIAGLPIPPVAPLPKVAVPKLVLAPVAPAGLAKPDLAPEVQEEVAFYCQKRIGQWTEAEARNLLGTPVRTRAALDEQKKPNGKIFAFRDPTSRYRDLELDFDSRTGNLRTVFVYPSRMTWQDVRRKWKGEVVAADAQSGRKFYSYENRHLDVLVDAQGKVISLGLY